MEESVPYNDIFNTMAEAKLAVPETNDDVIEELISKGHRLIEIGFTISDFRITEPFMNYPQVLESLKGYLSEECND